MSASVTEDQLTHQSPPEELETVTIRFAGDSGDGMQVTGSQFTSTSAIIGNDISTLPDFPAEIRAPAGSLPGVSGYQLNFSSRDIRTPGDDPQVREARKALDQVVGDALPQVLCLRLRVGRLEGESPHDAGLRGELRGTHPLGIRDRRDGRGDRAGSSRGCPGTARNVTTRAEEERGARTSADYSSPRCLRVGAHHPTSRVLPARGVHGAAKPVPPRR